MHVWYHPYAVGSELWHAPGDMLWEPKRTMSGINQPTNQVMWWVGGFVPDIGENG